MTSIKDVAQAAGVSMGTVSNVLNNRHVRPATAARVQQAIEKLNYSQNFSARNLAMGRSHILGMIVSDLENPFFTEITRRFYDQALMMNMETLVMHTNYDPSRTLECVRRLIGLQVPGVAVMTSELEPSVMRLLAENEICTVYFDLGTVGPWASKVMVNYEQGIHEAIEHLRQLGHARIGFISGPAALQSVLRRKQAFIEKMPAEFPRPLAIIDSDGSFQGGYFCCSKLLSAAPLSAIICANDLTALGAVHCARDKGLRVPQDLSIIGFDNTVVASYSYPALTAVHNPRDVIVRLAIEAIREMMESPTHAGRSYEVETGLIIRESTAPPPAGT